MKPKTCRTCTKTFAPNSGRQIYCKDCGRRGTFTCEGCGTTFKAIGNTRGKYCSLACFHETISKPETARRPCEVCKTVFKPRFPGQRTCSRACGGVIQRKPDKACAICGTIFRPKDAHTKTCSYTCSGLLRRLPRGNCERCGVAITAKYRQQRFCSKACRETPLGTKRTVQSGYVMVKVGEHPRADKRGFIFEHRHVMELALERPLEAYETVHHKNGVKDDNRIENLELRVGSHGTGASEAHCRTCTCFAH